MGCDTVVVLGSCTASGRVIFGKNTDREPNESNEVVYIARTQHQPTATSHDHDDAAHDDAAHDAAAPFGMLACSYISIPQVEETKAVLLVKPHWCWGAEMGAYVCRIFLAGTHAMALTRYCMRALIVCHESSNEYGVVIGNEAVFSHIAAVQERHLIGYVYATRLSSQSFDANRIEHIAMSRYRNGSLASIYHTTQRMDFVRLGLERATSATQARTVMIELLERYGQGGNCGDSHEFYYHNSYE